VLGLEGLAARLDDSLSLLGARHRLVTPRHRTMRAVIDWSYSLLGEDEQVFFRALAIFAGGFTVETVETVAVDAANARVDAIDRLADLVTKSLVVADVSGAKPRFRLLDTTRAYALEKLDESGERVAIARRHAEYHRDLFERAAIDAVTQPMTEWLATYRSRIDDVRAALDWSFLSAANGALAVALTAAAIPLWFALSLFPECRQYIERAIVAIEPDARAHTEMRLYYGLAASLFQTKGPVPETCDTWTKVLHIAETLGETEYQLRALWGLWQYRMNSGEHKAALTLAEEFGRLVSNQTGRTDLLMADRMIGSTLHYLGDQLSARRYLERAQARYVESIHDSNIVRFQLHPRIGALSVLARVLWIQGFANQALAAAKQSVEDAQAVGHPVTLITALFWAGQVALLASDLATAERYVTMLLDHSASQAMAIWTAWARGLDGVLLIQRGDLAGGLQVLRIALHELAEARSVPRYAVLFGPLVAGLARTGQINDGLQVIEEAIEHCERNSEGWIVPELLRIKGELLLLQGGGEGGSKAIDYFRRAVDLARRQGALAYELRAAISFARFQREQGRLAEARDLLGSVYGRFTEGFLTADLSTAKGLLDQLARTDEARCLD
jgi:predicted ATPase